MVKWHHDTLSRYYHEFNSRYPRMDINKMKERDKRLTSELRIKVLARLIGYNEIGEPIELVYVPQDNGYEIHVGGEYQRRASNYLVTETLSTK